MKPSVPGSAEPAALTWVGTMEASGEERQRLWRDRCNVVEGWTGGSEAATAGGMNKGGDSAGEGGWQKFVTL